MGFCLLVAVVGFIIAVLLLRDMKEKQKVFANFSNYLEEFVVVLSRDGVLLDISPRYVSDPLFELLCQKRSFDEILSTEENARLKEYVASLSTYPDIPFIFAFNGELGLRWYELRAVVPQKSGEDKLFFLLKNVTLDAESRTQRDKLQENVDMLLQNTGDFLWSLDVDTREFSMLTPLMDDEGRVVPRSLGVQNLRSMMRKEDFNLFEKRINERIVNFRALGHDTGEGRSLKLRLVDSEGGFTWYSFSCRMSVEENSKVVFRGAARRMDMVLESPVFSSGDSKNEMLSTVLAFPDIRVFWIDRDYRVVGCNRAFALGFRMADPREAVNRRLQNVVQAKYFSFMQGVLSKVFESGRAMSWKGPFGTDQSVLVFNAVPLKNDEGFVHRVLGVYMLLDLKDFKSKE